MSAQPTPIAQPAVPVFIAARHESVRAALWKLLESEPGVEPLAAIAGLADLRRLLAHGAPAVVVVDEAILGPDRIAELPGLIAAAPLSAFIVIGMGEHAVYVTRAREAGAADYVPLDEAERLGRSVREAGGATPPAALTTREAAGAPGRASSAGVAAPEPGARPPMGRSGRDMRRFGAADG
jgi:DNA-binding NarL/FixJ family response regulator